MRRQTYLACLPFLISAGPAAAHGALPGVEGFYAGLLHPFSTPAQALLLLGLALVVSGFKPEGTKFLFAGFLLASVLGLTVPYPFETIDAMLFAAAFLVCSLAALRPGKSILFSLVVVALGAGLIGVASVPDDGPIPDALPTMAGSLIGANLGLFYLAGVFLLARNRFTNPWVDVAFRVAAAWLGAISLLMLALGFADPVLAV